MAIKQQEEATREISSTVQQISMAAQATFLRGEIDRFVDSVRNE